jgi:glycosyltransferase involved in cell wall biosynthesis
VILHYNRPWCLEIAVASLRRALARTRLAHEFVLADDGSDDELWPLFDRLPLDQIFVQPTRIYDGERSSIYDTISAAYQLARYPYVLFLEDDFWFIPQGFRDQGKNHVDGLLSRPDFDASCDPLTGAVQLLEETAEAHFVELARSFRNPRYHCIPKTERSACGVSFQAKSQALTLRFYTCAWPHIMRTDEARSVPLPLGVACWSGERQLAAARRRVFGPGDWVYNPQQCFFAHVNIFTWREVYGRAGADSHMQWTDVGDDRALPFQFESIPAFNQILLERYKKGLIANDLDAYFDTSPMAYVYHTFLRSVCA